MNKLKITYVCLFIVFFILTGLTFFKIKHMEDFQQKAVLAVEIRKVLETLMFDLREAREDTIQGIPADGLWYHRIAFDRARQGALEYTIKDGHLLRTNKGQTLLIADHIADISLRRQANAPGILEVRIEARHNVSLISNLRIRMRE
jgi:hypothetical protein